MSTVIFYIDGIEDLSTDPQNVELSGQCVGTQLEFLSVSARAGGVLGNLNPNAWLGSIFVPQNKYDDLMTCLNSLPIQIVITFDQLANGRFRVTDISCSPLMGINRVLAQARVESFKVGRHAAQVTKSNIRLGKLLEPLHKRYGSESPHTSAEAEQVTELLHQALKELHVEAPC